MVRDSGTGCVIQLMEKVGKVRGASGGQVENVKLCFQDVGVVMY